MHLIGPANWFLPAALARILPRLDIETGAAEPAEAAAVMPVTRTAAGPSVG
jgi:uncharacterized membrane protein YdfJ with MMPL/SSD domain